MKTLCPAISFLSRDMSLKTVKKIEVEDIPETRAASHDYSLRNSDPLTTFNDRTERYSRGFFSGTSRILKTT